MNNAIKAILKYAFNNFNFEHIEAYTHKENTGSRKLLKKLEFNFVANKIDEIKKTRALTISVFLQH